ncbi:hypothetical protein BD560DRAFT_488285 [Blakeslea trispora]|nr:hypothetical protein BD560DRAFT_488285 [Blakeslea trispora]
MSNESSACSYTSQKKKSIDRTRYSDHFVLSDIKQRKFRWSSCFSFVSKLKKTKSNSEQEQQIRVAQSYEHIVASDRLDAIVKVKSEEFSPSLWPTQTLPLPQPQLQPPSSLSPPPRQIKLKRESISYKEENPLLVESKPRVIPRAIKTSSSLLRLSLDAEALSSPESLENEGLSHRFSTASSNFTGSQPAPFRTGTLGSCSSQTNSSVASHHSPNHYAFQSLPLPPNTAIPPPPLPPHIPMDSPGPDKTQVEDQDKKLALKDRRRRRSPLLAPSADQLTLALKDIHLKEEAMKHKKECERSHWLEPTVERRQANVVSLQPIAQVQELDQQFYSRRSTEVVGREKAQYDAIVSRTTSLHRRQLSHEDQKRPLQSTNHYRTSLRARSPSFSESAKPQEENEERQLSMICENQPLTTSGPTPPNQGKPFFASRHHLTVTPETPPYHKHMAPSLISAPSTPNSLDSFDQEDYIHHKRPSFSFS